MTSARSEASRNRRYGRARFEHARTPRTAHGAPSRPRYPVGRGPEPRQASTAVVTRSITARPACGTPSLARSAKHCFRASPPPTSDAHNTILPALRFEKVGADGSCRAPLPGQPDDGCLGVGSPVWMFFVGMADERGPVPPGVAQRETFGAHQGQLGGRAGMQQAGPRAGPTTRQCQPQRQPHRSRGRQRTQRCGRSARRAGSASGTVPLAGQLPRGCLPYPVRTRTSTPESSRRPSRCCALCRVGCRNEQKPRRTRSRSLRMPLSGAPRGLLTPLLAAGQLAASRAAAG